VHTVAVAHEGEGGQIVYPAPAERPRVGLRGVHTRVPCIAFRYIPLRSMALRGMPLCYISSIPLHMIDSIPLRCVTRRCIPSHCVSIHSLHCTQGGQDAGASPWRTCNPITPASAPSPSPCCAACLRASRSTDGAVRKACTWRHHARCIIIIIMLPLSCSCLITRAHS